MKLFLVVYVSVAIFLLYRIFVEHPRTNYNLCLSSAETARAEMDARSCQAKKDVYTELSSCIVAEQKQGTVASFLYKPLGIQSRAELLITAHNKDCPAEKVNVPGESLYLLSK